MADQFRLDDSLMHCRSAYTALPMPPVERHRKENVCGLGAAIRDHQIVRSPLEVRIFKVHVRSPMTGRRHVDQTPACTDESRNPVDQDKVP